jgi:hypothetical protein
LLDGAPDPKEMDAEDCSFLDVHTILFVLGGVVVDFGVFSFGLHTSLFFFGGVGTTFGAFSFVICLTFFYLGFFLISLVFFTGLSTI